MCVFGVVNKNHIKYIYKKRMYVYRQIGNASVEGGIRFYNKKRDLNKSGLVV